MTPGNDSPSVKITPSSSCIKLIEAKSLQSSSMQVSGCPTVLDMSQFWVKPHFDSRSSTKWYCGLLNGMRTKTLNDENKHQVPQRTVLRHILFLVSHSWNRQPFRLLPFCLPKHNLNKLEAFFLVLSNPSILQQSLSESHSYSSNMPPREALDPDLRGWPKHLVNINPQLGTTLEDLQSNLEQTGDRVTLHVSKAEPLVCLVRDLQAPSTIEYLQPSPDELGSLNETAKEDAKRIKKCATEERLAGLVRDSQVASAIEQLQSYLGWILVLEGRRCQTYQKAQVRDPFWGGESNSTLTWFKAGIILIGMCSLALQRLPIHSRKEAGRYHRVRCWAAIIGVCCYAIMDLGAVSFLDACSCTVVRFALVEWAQSSTLAEFRKHIEANARNSFGSWSKRSSWDYHQI